MFISAVRSDASRGNLRRLALAEYLYCWIALITNQQHQISTHGKRN